jgi:hypothetical protein
MKEKLAIFYIGLPRYETIGKQNHQQLIEALKTHWDIVEYNFCFPNIDRSSYPFTEHKKWGHGQTQVWDFYTALDSIRETFVLKMRTDVWLAKSSIEYVSNELLNVQNSSKDLIYFGTDERSPDLHMQRAHYDIPKAKVLDLIIAANKTKISSKEDAFVKLSQVKSKNNGNASYTVLIHNPQKTNVVPLKICPIRKEYSNYPTTKQVFLDWVDWFPEDDYNALNYKRWLTDQLEEFEEPKLKLALEVSPGRIVRRKLAPPPSRTNTQPIAQSWKGFR